MFGCPEIVLSDSEILISKMRLKIIQDSKIVPILRNRFLLGDYASHQYV